MENQVRHTVTSNHHQWVKLLKEGRKEAFKEIYEEYHGMLLSLSMHYVEDREEAKEAVQNAFVKLWENRATLLDNTNLKNFLYTIVKNNSINYLKKSEFILRSHENLKWMEMHYAYEAMSRLEFESIEFKELKGVIEEAVDKLPHHSRTVFKMSRFEDIRNKDIAKQLNITEKTVEAHMTKALKQLRKDLQSYLPLIIAISDILR